MKKALVRIGLIVASVVLVTEGVLTALPSQRDVQFDRLLQIAAQADAELDALEAQARIRYEVPEGSSQTGLEAEWEAIKPRTTAELHQWAIAILYLINEEGFGKVLVSDVGFKEYGPIVRSAVAGTFGTFTYVISLNVKYISDPSWSTDNYLGVLTHELIHAAGYHNESETQVMTLEVLSAMSALGYPSIRAVLMQEIRGYALRTAFLMAQYGYAPIASTFANRCSQNGCGSGTIDTGLLAQWNEARIQLYSSEELRYGNKRIRWWMNDELHPFMDYAGVLLAYSMRPMLVALEGACSPDHKVKQTFSQERVPEIIKGIPTGRSYPGQVPGPLLDDLAAVFAEIGVCK